ncbi:hypothetical protein [Embleya hyalina]|uniref:Uncharacterized protein n=1 Tax=Embleya hyalina TaxID=516124 RepID=A0A401YT95_9ACTN|nr:hypothetical protein [Embleya hyalina]GCD97814.1 hypothetical protein EHYA_05511 [Embleya hyalina]
MAQWRESGSRSPWGIIGEYFTPEHRIAPPDPFMERMQLLRSWVSVGIVLWMCYQYGFDYDEFKSEATGNLTIGVGTALLMVPLIGLVLILVADPAARPDVRRDMAAPLGRVVAFVVIGAVSIRGMSYADAHETVLSLFVVTPLALMATVVFICAAWYSTRHLFNAVDGHLLMPSLVGPWVPWAIACANIGDSGDNVPAGVGLTVSFGGAVLVTVLAVWEHLRVRELYGISLRHPDPGSADATDA